MPPIVDRTTTLHSNYIGQDPPRVGYFLHDTEGASDLTVAESSGGWNRLIGRAGVIYLDVPENRGAWHVRACDRWRPAEILACPKKYQPLSDANYCTLGMEITSGAGFRAAGKPYTSEQLVSVLWQLHDWYKRYGRKPIWRHGDVQLDRSDPVALDLAALGLVTTDGKTWYLPEILPVPEPPMNTDQPILSDQEATYDLLPQIWPTNLLADPTYAIPQGWLDEWRKGRYRGFPLGGEIGLPSGAVYQQFEYGIAVYKDGRVSWNG